MLLVTAGAVIGAAALLVGVIALCCLAVGDDLAGLRRFWFGGS